VAFENTLKTNPTNYSTKLKSLTKLLHDLLQSLKQYQQQRD